MRGGLDGVELLNDGLKGSSLVVFLPAQAKADPTGQVVNEQTSLVIDSGQKPIIIAGANTGNIVGGGCTLLGYEGKP